MRIFKNKSGKITVHVQLWFRQQKIILMTVVPGSQGKLVPIPAAHGGGNSLLVAGASIPSFQSLWSNRLPIPVDALRIQTLP